MIVGTSLPSIQDIYYTCLIRKALCNTGDSTYPSISLLPSDLFTDSPNPLANELFPTSTWIVLNTAAYISILLYCVVVAGCDLQGRAGQVGTPVRHQ